MPLSKKSLAGKGSKLASRKMSGFARTAVKDARRNTQRVASSIAPEDGQPPKPPGETEIEFDREQYVGYALIKWKAIERLKNVSQTKSTKVVIDVLATGSNPLDHSKWSDRYLRRHGVDIIQTKGFEYTPQVQRAPCSTQMVIPLLGPVMHQELKFSVLLGDVDAGKVDKTAQRKLGHRSVGQATLHLQPLVVDDRPQHLSIPLTKNVQVVATHKTRDRKSDAIDGLSYAEKGDADDSALTISEDAGFIKAQISIHVDPELDARAYFRKPEPLVLVDPHFTASRLYHGLYVCGEEFINPGLDWGYRMMGVLAWEEYWRTCGWLYFWLTVCVHPEWFIFFFHCYLISIIATYPYYHLKLTPLQTAMLCFADLADVDTNKQQADDGKHDDEEEFAITTMCPAALFDLAKNKRPKKWGKFPTICNLNAGAGPLDPNHDANQAALSVGDLLLAIDDVALGDQTVEEIRTFLQDLEDQVEAGTHPHIMLSFRRRNVAHKSVNTMMKNLGQKFGNIAKHVAGNVKPRKKRDKNQNFDEFGDEIGTGEVAENAKLAAEYSEISDAHLPAMWNRIITSMLGAKGHSPDTIYEIDPRTGKMKMQVDDQEFDMHWVDPDPLNPTSLALTLQNAQNNCENAARFGFNLRTTFQWHDTVATRNVLRILVASAVVHYWFSNRAIWFCGVCGMFLNGTEFVTLPQFKLASWRAQRRDQAAAAAFKSKATAARLSNSVSYIRVYECQTLVEGQWEASICSDDAPPGWYDPRFPKLRGQSPDRIFINEEYYRWANGEDSSTTGGWCTVKVNEIGETVTGAERTVFTTATDEMLPGAAKKGSGHSSHSHSLFFNRKSSSSTAVLAAVTHTDPVDPNVAYYQYAETFSQFKEDIPAAGFERLLKSRVRRRCWQRGILSVPAAPASPSSPA